MHLDTERPYVYLCQKFWNQSNGDGKERMFSIFSRSRATSFFPLFVLHFLRHLISCVSVSPHPVRSVSFHMYTVSPRDTLQKLTNEVIITLENLNQPFYLQNVQGYKDMWSDQCQIWPGFVLSCLPGRHPSIIIYSFLQKAFTMQGWTGKQIRHGSHPHQLLPVGTFLHHWHSPASSFMIFHGYFPVKLSRVSF